jgi:hypothetical protein
VTAQPGTGAQTTATYVYGVVHASNAPKIDATGVGRGAPVRAVTHESLAALVSDVDQGFVEAGRTDGDNEEGAPDILYVWGGSRVARGWLG